MRSADFFGSVQSSPPRSAFVTILALAIIVSSALLLPISFVTLLMIWVGSYGTESVDALGFLLVVVAPPATLVAGIGLMRRRAWAWGYVLLALGTVIAAELWQLLASMWVAPDGLLRSTTGAAGFGAGSRALVLAAGAAVAAKLLSPAVRAEFGISGTQRRSPLPAEGRRSPHAVDARARAAPPRESARQMAALVLAVALLLGAAGGLGWLVKSGLDRGTTTLPMSRASLRRTVSREREPATFWLAIGVYAGAGLGSGGLALWCVGATVATTRSGARNE